MYIFYFFNFIFNYFKS